MLDNDVTRPFAIYDGEILLQGSIAWVPGHDFWYHDAAASISTVDCAVSHTSTDVPATVYVVDPQIGAGYAPGGNSFALDNCDDMVVTPQSDACRQDVPHDVPGSPNGYGAHDLGAVEQTDVIFANGFGISRLTS